MRFSALTERVARTGQHGWAVHQDAMRLRDAGADVIFLTIGDPDQAPPETLIEATVAALREHRTGYSPTIGYPALREAIAARHAWRTGRLCAADNVVVVPGAQGGVYCALQCLAGPGDEVIVPEPIYATYEGVVGASGARMVTVPLRADRGFHPDLEALSAAITPCTRVIWINSPHNPTGAVFTAGEMEAIGALCRHRDLWLLSDEVYEDLAFARPHVGPWSLPDMADRTVVISSLSESHAVPAFRLGWIIGPPALCRHLFNLLLSMTYGSPAFIQIGALAALRDDLPEVAALRTAYQARAAELCGLLTEAPNCRAIPPEGGMFVLLDIRPSGLSAQQFAQQLLEREHVAVLPCDNFGPSAVGHLRIALSAPDARLAEAGRRIVRFARQLA
jgi:arginine:pyruvate transaminase